ncbi:hypothetical protein AAFF_G00058030 [Aldrovandia affinis]|uniref:Uncharacterized protein n=1 Tax=Aldrovandia affinis TaxID=143900 RepID=A0AAD7R2C6_9TELE|nr:hypothetical protein AAFF_G00058030 [Aldrovandia affinis]
MWIKSAFFSSSLVKNLFCSSSTSDQSNTLLRGKGQGRALHVNCESRNITKISQVAVPSGVPFHLNLYKNDLVELNADDLSGLKGALSLHLGANSIQELEPGVFASLTPGSSTPTELPGRSPRRHIPGGLSAPSSSRPTPTSSAAAEPAFVKLFRLKVLILNDNARRLPARQRVSASRRSRTWIYAATASASLPFVGFLEHVGGSRTPPGR